MNLIEPKNILISNVKLYNIFESIMIGRFQLENISNLILKHNKFPDEYFVVVESNTIDSTSEIIKNISNTNRLNLNNIDVEDETFNISVLTFTTEENGKISVKTLGIFEWFVHLKLNNNQINIDDLFVKADWSLYYVDKNILEFTEENLRELYEDKNFKEILNNDDL